MRKTRWTAALVVAASALAGAGGAQPLAGPAPRKAITQAEAVRLPTGKNVAVEFLVGTTTLGRYNDDRAEPRLVILHPKESLPGGDRFEAVLAGRAVAHLDRLGLLAGGRPDRHFDDAVVRVTGPLEAFGPDVARTFRVTVFDPDGFEVFRPRPR